MVDADDCIVLANAQAADFLGVAPDLLKPGTPLAQLEPALQGAADAADMLIRRDDDVQATSETLMADGRWLRISRSPTRDDGFIVLCSDISRLKTQERSLRETNLLLDAALENMSQGLCLFDAQNRLEVFNRRFLEIFKLPPDQIKPGITFREVLEISIACGNHPGKTSEQSWRSAQQRSQGERHRPALCTNSPTAASCRVCYTPDRGRPLGRDLRGRHRTPPGRSQDHAHGAA